MMYVERVRAYSEKYTLSEAVEKAVDECINEGILEKFLRSNRAEVIAVSIYEYDEEQHAETLRSEGYEEGEKAGEKAGRRYGEQRMVKLASLLISTGKTDVLKQALNNEEYREKLYMEYSL